MSFSSDVKQEIIGQRIKRESDARALLSAFTLSIGSLKLVPSMRCWGIYFVSESEASILYVAKLATQYYNLEFNISKVKHERLNAEYNELLLYGNEIEDFMLQMGFMTENSDGDRNYNPMVPKEEIITDIQKRSFVRGLFLACGTVSEPNKAYHAEFVLKNEGIVLYAIELLSKFGIAAKHTKRKTSEIVYIKDGEQLEDLLALLGASTAMMEVANTRIRKQASNEANRSVNCINANLDRVSRASIKQTEDIRLVINTLGYDGISNQLKLVAEARLNNYELSLSELAEEMGLGKSAVNYRLKKLSDMAENIRNGNM